MARLLLCAAVLALLCAFSCAKAPEPGTLDLQTLHFGKPTRCKVLLYDQRGEKLIAEHQSDGRGSLLIGGLKQGDYMLRFEDVSGRSYSAERGFSIDAGSTLEMRVELTRDGSAAPGGAEEIPAVAGRAER